MPPESRSTSGLFALACAFACVACFFVPDLLTLWSQHASASSRDEEFLQGAAMVAAVYAAFLGTLGFGVITLVAALFAMRDGNRGQARLSLLIIFGVVLWVLRGQWNDHQRLPPSEREEKLDPDCVNAALSGQVQPPKCFRPPQSP